MIVKMEKLAFCGLSEDKERILKELMRRGCVQLRSPETVEDLKDLLGSVNRTAPCSTIRSRKPQSIVP
jgi:hypothetical protein